MNPAERFIVALLREHVELGLPMSPGGAQRALNEINALSVESERREKPVSAIIRPT